ncbi:TRAP transporter substrate-binding protein DctP [Rhizobium sp. L1K21]|uniref:TRAP transporter substrate-binding protein DctP n=1 Tax=Rhizobium sp. L1K21 TaxID=2954933 RepID=UPI002093D346|nr:TRAP transporter substrate-binding protein DctP [Rhizobium sp. L1K21]MCO6188416.1 TRAP transporter substrate-binding protein DctP [Rhizobium sp. L1K21]
MKKFLKIQVASLLLLQTFMSAAWSAEYTMRIASGANSAGFTCKEFLAGWGEKIKAASGGRIDYELYCDGKLGKMGDTVNRVEYGLAEVGWDIPLAYGQRFAPLGVVGVPGLYKDPAKAAGALWKLYESGVIPEDSAVRIALLQTFGNTSLWTKDKVEDLTTLDGLKIAMGSRERAITLQSMGAAPVNLRVPEYYQAVAKGVADGIFSTDTSVFDFSMTELLKYNYRASFGGGVVGLFMNKNWYSSLPDELKKVIDENSGYEGSKWASNLLAESEKVLLKNAETDHGVTVHKLTPEEIDAWQPAFEKTKEAWVGAIPNGEAYLSGFKAGLAEEADQ